MKRFRVYIDYDLCEVKVVPIVAANAVDARLVAEFECMVEGMGGEVVAVEGTEIYV